MADSKESLFSRLTKLFRSGPVVRRRVRSAVDPGGSTAFELFRRNVSDVYSSTVSAYGQFDRMSRYSDFAEMEACVSGDTLIAVPNGYMTIHDLSEKYGPDETFVVYSYDHVNGRITPALGKCARKTITDRALKVTFDSGKTLVATPDHRVMRRDGTYCEVQELKPGDSMMPFYRKAFYEKMSSESGLGYQYVYTMDKSLSKNGWVSEHRLIAEWVAGRKLEPNEVVHHVNFVKHDNRPENLRIMDDADHRRYHTEILNGKKWAPENNEWIEKFKANHSAFMKEHNPATRHDVTFEKILALCDVYGFKQNEIMRRLDCSLRVISRRLRNKGFTSFEQFATTYDSKWRNSSWDNAGCKNPRYDSSLTFQLICDTYVDGMKITTLCSRLGTTGVKVKNRLKSNGYKTWDQFVAGHVNHKVVSVEEFGVIDLYDLTVDGFKNYATDSIIVHNTPEIGCFTADTIIDTPRGPITISELLSLQQSNLFTTHEWCHPVMSYDLVTGEFVTGVARQVRFTKRSQVVEVTFDNGATVRCTPDHKFLVARHAWVQAQDLYAGQHLVSSPPRKVAGVTWLDGEHDVYDMTVDTYNNFMVAGAVVHNSALDVFSEESCSQDEHGRVLHVSSENRVIKELLEHLFYDVVNVDFNLPLMARNLPVRHDTVIPLMSGEDVTIADLSERVKAGEECWVYSLQDASNKLVPGRVTWCDKTRSNERMLRVTLDDGTYVETSPDHEFVMRDSSRRRAEEISVDDSLMPFCGRLASNVDSDCFDIGVLSDQRRVVCRIEEVGRSDAYCMEVLGPTGQHDRHNFMVLGRISSERVNSKSGICLQNCKYGDTFQFIDVDPKFGVMNLYPIPISEVEREEGYDPKDPQAVRFRWITRGNAVLENWQVAHFRLLGNDAFLPYGSSVLESARRIWRQLILIEDAMLVYRISRAPERRIFYVDVANVPPEEIENYMQQATTSLKRNSVVERTAGKGDLRYNALSVSDDFFIPVRGTESGTKIDTLPGGQNAAAVEDVQYIQKKLFAALKVPKAFLNYDEDLGCLVGDTQVSLLDGRTLTMAELVTEHDQGRQNWVYSFTDKGEPKPGRIVKAWKTKDVTELVRVTLDSGRVIECTDNHPFMLADGTYVEASKLKGDESLMALYRRISSRRNRPRDVLSGYEMILDHGQRKYVYTHTVVAKNARIAEHESSSLEKQSVIHHASFNKLNNDPSELIRMGKKEHVRLHGRLANNLTSEESRRKLSEIRKTDEFRRAHLDGVKRAWKEDNGDRRKRTIDCNREHRKMEKMQTKLDQLIAEGVISRKREHNGMWTRRPSFNEIVNAIGDDAFSPGMIGVKLGTSGVAVAEVIRNEGYTWHEFAARFDRTRRGRKITRLDLDKFKAIANESKTTAEFFERARISLAGFNGYLKRSGIDAKQWYKENICRSNHRVLSVEKIALDRAIPVYDLEIEDWHNFSLECGVVVHNSKSTLAQADIRFSRSISRIQKVLISELNKVAMIHLYSHGFTGDDLLNFTLSLNNPSSVAQLQKLELIKSKFDIASQVPEGAVDREWIRRNVLGLSFDEIERVKAGRKADKLEDTEVESATAESGGGGEDLGSSETSLSGEGPSDTGDLGGEGGGEGSAEDLFASDEAPDSPPLREVDGLPIRPKNEAQGAFGNKTGRRRRSFSNSSAEIPDFLTSTMDLHPQSSTREPFGYRNMRAGEHEEDELSASLSDAVLGEDFVTVLPRMTG